MAVLDERQPEGIERVNDNAHSFYPWQEVAMPSDNHDAAFRPDGLSIEGVDRTEVRLVWEHDSGDRRVIVLQRSQLPAALHELQKQIAPGSGVPINLDSFRPGVTFAPVGFSFGPRADHFVLTANVELPEQHRGVFVPLRLSKKDVEDVVRAMTRWLEKQNAGQPSVP